MSTMNSRLTAGGSAPEDGQSRLSLLVNAADKRDSLIREREEAAQFGETLRLRGVTSSEQQGAQSLQEQLLFRQQQLYGAAASRAGFLSQLTDHTVLSQLGNQGYYQQLSAVLGLGTGGSSADARSALAAAQFRQQQNQQTQLSQADILALSYSGNLSSALHNHSGLGSSGFGIPRGVRSGLTGLGAGGGLAAGLGTANVGGSLGGLRLVGGPSEDAAIQARLASELQRLEDIERCHRLMATGSSSVIQGAAPGQADSTTSSQGSKKDVKVGDVLNASSILGHENSKKEEPEKQNNGSVIVPCRARGMPMDHNFKTAYFVLPQGVRHGENLICSYSACRNTGIKFRYCSHCKVPVAKRNFHKRHRHGNKDNSSIHGDSEVSDGEADEEKMGTPSQIASKCLGANVQSSNNDSNNRDMQEGQAQSPMWIFDEKTEGQPTICQDRMARWRSLLGQRPATKEGELMSSWLMDVLAVSDLDKPFMPSSNIDSKPKTDSNPTDEVGDSKLAAKDNVASSDAMKKRSSGAEPSDIPGSISSASETADKGAFAAWKGRKKQKSQSKTSSNQEEEA